MDNNRFNLFRITLIVCLSFFLLALPALAADSSLSVECRDSAGNPVSGVDVQIQILQTGKWKDKKSDNKGMASFNKIDEGIYRVVGRKDGLVPALYEFADCKAGSQQTVTLKLEAGDSNTKLYFEDQALGQKAMGLLNQANELLRNSKFAESEKDLQASLEINPSNPDAYFLLGIVSIQLHKWANASTALKRSAELCTMLSSLPKPKGAATSPSPYDDLKQRVQTVLAKLPAFELRSDADKALSERKFDLAIEKYREALKVEPDDPDLFYNLSLALANGKHYDEALQTIDRAIQIKPAEKAYADLKKKISDFKENEILTRAQGFLTEGDKLLQGQKYAEALAKYDEALKLVPPDKRQAIVLIQIAKAQSLLNHPDEALAAYKKAIELAPDNADYRKSLAQFYLKEKKYDEALNIYADPSAAGNQPVDKTLFSLGQTLNNQGNSEVAELAFERAIKANPNNAEAYYELGMILYYSKKDDKRAKELLNKYLEIGQDKSHKDNTLSVLAVLKKRSP